MKRTGNLYTLIANEASLLAAYKQARIGKGTHKAADWAQQMMRAAPRNAWTLHVDVRKFFYSIDRQTLLALLARHIKCQRTLDLLALFSHRPEPTGIPIGNLLSQTFANVYLNSLDQFCKRSLALKWYGRYMDDSVMLVRSRLHGLDVLAQITTHLAALGLSISHHSLQPIKRGINFVGYRTWASARFVRQSLVSAVRSDARHGRLPQLVSRLGCALRTCSHTPLIRYIQEHHHAIFDCLPQSHFPRNHHCASPAA